MNTNINEQLVVKLEVKNDTSAKDQTYDTALYVVQETKRLSRDIFTSIHVLTEAYYADALNHDYYITEKRKYQDQLSLLKNRLVNIKKVIQDTQDDNRMSDLLEKCENLLPKFLRVL